MTDFEKATLFRAISVTALLVAGVILLPWLAAKIACGALIVWMSARVAAAYYAAR
jgi:hypothetical protein